MPSDKIRTTNAVDHHRWSEMIRDGASDRGVGNILQAVNVATKLELSNRADVIVACAQILAQNITANPTIAAEIRLGIMSMIDGYAMRVAINEH